MANHANCEASGASSLRCIDDAVINDTSSSSSSCDEANSCSSDSASDSIIMRRLNDEERQIISGDGTIAVDVVTVGDSGGDGIRSLGNKARQSSECSNASFSYFSDDLLVPKIEGTNLNGTSSTLIDNESNLPTTTNNSDGSLARKHVHLSANSSTVTESEVNTNNSNMEAAVQSVSEIKPLENHLKERLNENAVERLRPSNATTEESVTGNNDYKRPVKKMSERGCQTYLDQKSFAQIATRIQNSQIRLQLQPGHQEEQPSTKVTTVSTSVDTSSPSSSSDGILRLTIKNFKSMTDTVRGESKEIQSIPWRIMVMPRQHVVQKKGTQKCLGFFLQCCPNAYSDSWSCQAAAELRLISQKASVPHFTRKTNHVYTAKENDWGYSCFMTWADIQDEEQGYIKDDTVILEVSVKAEPAKNVLTQEQFRKKIQDYKRLADIQSSRGYLDKAIECNASALKFCRDRDKACREELEIQKQQLIDLKLKQSIERIEKGPISGKGDEESIGNHNAVKQAITGTTNKQTNIGKGFKPSSNGKAKDNSNIERNQHQQSQQRLQTPPPPAKPTVEKRNFIEKIGTETHLDDLKIEKEIPMPGITAATCKDVCKNPKGQRKSVPNDSTLQHCERKSIELNLLDAKGELVKNDSRFADRAHNLIGMKKNEIIKSDEIFENSKDELKKTQQQVMKSCKEELEMNIQNAKNVEKFEDVNKSHEKSMLVNNTCQTDISICWDDHNWELNEAAIFSQANVPIIASITNQPRYFSKRTGRKNLQSPKIEDIDWRMKKMNNIDTSNQKIKSIERRNEVAAEDLSNEALTTLNSHPSDFIFKNMASIDGSSSVFLDSTATVPFAEDVSRAEDIYTKPYIEEWLKYHIKTCWRYTSGDHAQIGDEATIDLSQFSEGQVQQVMAALSVIGVNCMNARRVVDRAADFIATLENRTKNPLLKDCLIKIAQLAGDEKSVEALREFRQAGGRETDREKDFVVEDSVVRGEEFQNAETEDFRNFLASLDCAEDSNDYLLHNEVRRINMYADQAFKSPFLEIHQVEKLNEHIDRITAKITALLNDKEVLQKTLASEKARSNKSEQKHTSMIKSMETQLKCEKEKLQRTEQVLTQKKNECKKYERQIKEKDFEIERIRPFEKRYEQLKMEEQELRSVHSTNMAKKDSEIQALKEAYVREQYDSQEREKQLRDSIDKQKELYSGVMRDLNAERAKLFNYIERARKSEELLLMERWGNGRILLEKFVQEAEQQIALYKLEQKRVGSDLNMDELKRAIAELEGLKIEVNEKLKACNLECNSQIEQIRKGTKTLASLPKFEIPKPPTLPKFKFDCNQPQLSNRSDKSSPLSSIGVIGQGTRTPTSSSSIGVIRSANQGSKHIDYSSAISTDLTTNTPWNLDNPRFFGPLVPNDFATPIQSIASTLGSAHTLDQDSPSGQCNNAFRNTLPSQLWSGSSWNTDARAQPAAPSVPSGSGRFGQGLDVGFSNQLLYDQWESGPVTNQSNQSPMNADFEKIIDSWYEKARQYFGSHPSITRANVREGFVSYNQIRDMNLSFNENLFFSHLQNNYIKPYGQGISPAILPPNAATPEIYQAQRFSQFAPGVGPTFDIYQRYRQNQPIPPPPPVQNVKRDAYPSPIHPHLLLQSQGEGQMN